MKSYFVKYTSRRSKKEKFSLPLAVAGDKLNLVGGPVDDDMD